MKMLRGYCVFVALLLQILGMLLFLFGFFAINEIPIQVYWDSFSEDKSNSSLDFNETQQLNANQLEANPDLLQLESHCSDHVNHEKPLFDKLVFVVIDSMRADMMPTLCSQYTEHFQELRCPSTPSMPFLENLVTRKKALGLISVVNMPTVTMPRIKALMTGTLPAFIDLVLNFNPVKFKGDSLLEQASKKGKRMVFAGDSTWLELFSSSLFKKAVPIPSFGVTDFTECDIVVTNALNDQLKNLTQWDVVILHYLGVDHIGHVYSRWTGKMHRKLQQMDNVFEAINKSVSTSNESYLIVTTGDHGMTDTGSHGSNSLYETLTPLLFLPLGRGVVDTIIVNASERQPVKQIDIAATLSALLGLPFPRRSKGRLIGSALKGLGMKRETRLCYYFQNAFHMNKFVDYNVNETLTRFETIVEKHSFLMNSDQKTENKVTLQEDLIRAYDQYIESIQVKVAATATIPQLNIVIVAILILFSSFLVLLLPNVCDVHKVIFICSQHISVVFLLTLLIIPMVAVFATSFIKCEGIYWSFCSQTVMLGIFFEYLSKWRKRKGQLSFRREFVFSFVFVFCLIIVRGMNEYQALVDYKDHFISHKMGVKILATASVIVSLIAVVKEMRSISKREYERFPFMQLMFFVLILFVVYFYKLDFDQVFPLMPRINLIDANSKARVIYALIGVFLITFSLKIKLTKAQSFCRLSISLVPFLGFLRHVKTAWIGLSLLLFQPRLLPLLCLCIVFEMILYKMLKETLIENNLWSVLPGSRDKQLTYTITFFTVVYLIFATASFYNQGNTYSLGTIDVNAGYIGIDTYQQFIVGLLVTAHTFSLYIFWVLSLVIRLTEVNNIYNELVFDFGSRYAVHLIVASQFLSLSIYSSIVIIQSHNVLVTEYFGPKLLYVCYTTVVIAIYYLSLRTAQRILS